MLVGFIQTKDVLLHPVSVISLVGLKGLVRLIRLGLSHRPSTFLEQLNLVLSGRPTCSHSDCLADFRRDVSEKIH